MVQPSELQGLIPFIRPSSGLSWAVSWWSLLMCSSSLMCTEAWAGFPVCVFWSGCSDSSMRVRRKAITLSVLECRFCSRSGLNHHVFIVYKHAQNKHYVPTDLFSLFFLHRSADSKSLLLFYSIWHHQTAELRVSSTPCRTTSGDADPQNTATKMADLTTASMRAGNTAWHQLDQAW